MMKNAIEVSGLVVVRSGREVLDGPRPDDPAGPGDRAARAQRVRQVDADALRRRRAADPVRRRSRCSASPPGAAACATGWPTRPRLPSVYDDLTVTENLRFFARVLGTGRADADRAIEAVDLGSHRDQVVRNLSGGQRSRANLAVAMLGRRRGAGARRADRRPRPGAARAALGRCSTGSRTPAPPCSSAATSWTRPSAATGCC